jgi:hypothetical protein
MNGLDQPDLPYQLGRFVEQGWGAKVVIDFMMNEEKLSPLPASIPTPRMCSCQRGRWWARAVGARICLAARWRHGDQPPEGRCDEFLRRAHDLRQPPPVGLCDYAGNSRCSRDAWCER